jgi:glucan endo-1,3-alpha-glucosidase
MPHDGWRDVSQAYITAYKNGASSATVSKDEIVYYYRTFPKGTTCSDSVSQPTGYQDDDDSVYAITMLTSPGTLTITSGSNAGVQYSVPAGISLWSAPMGIGTQTFELQRNGATVLSGSGSKQISNTCTVYNFNAFVGTVV